MISKIQIKNFRIHKDLEIELGSGVTTLIGESAEGKSNLIRSIKFVALNKPSGDKMINWDADSVIVRVTVDGKKAIRKKGKIGNIYKYDKKEYKAFGNEVPPAIVELFNLSEINFQGQFEEPFWFCKTAGEVSRALNKIVNLNIIDKTLKNIASVISSDNSEIKVYEKQLEASKEKVEELSYVDAMDKDFQTIETLQSDIDENARGLVVLAKLVESGSKYRATVKNASDQVVLGKIAIEKEAEYRIITNSVKSLSKLLKSGRRYNKIIKNKPPDIEPLKKLLSDYQEISDNRIELKNLLTKFGKYNHEIDLWQTRKKDLEWEIKELGIKFCKECGQPITS